MSPAPAPPGASGHRSRVGSMRDPARPVAAVLVVGLHAAVLGGLMAMPPLRAMLEADRAVEVWLIAGPDTAAVPMPDVTFEVAAPDVAAPELPLPESVPAPASSLAITLPLAVPAPAATTDAPGAVAPEVDAASVEYLVAPSPRYPPASKRLREQGVVTLRVLVAADGKPATVEVAQSSGSARLDAAAREAVLHAMFRPYSDGGQPRAAWVRVPIEFTLRRG